MYTIEISSSETGLSWIEGVGDKYEIIRVLKQNIIKDFDISYYRITEWQEGNCMGQSNKIYETNLWEKSHVDRFIKICEDHL
jgi:hypothetical protein